MCEHIYVSAYLVDKMVFVKIEGEKKNDFRLRTKWIQDENIERKTVL